MLLDEVISNLLENAARYAPSGTSVSVELTSGEGPTNTRSLSAQARAKAGFSARNP